MRELLKHSRKTAMKWHFLQGHFVLRSVNMVIWKSRSLIAICLQYMYMPSDSRDSWRYSCQQIMCRCESRTERRWKNGTGQVFLMTADLCIWNVSCCPKAIAGLLIIWAVLRESPLEMNSLCYASLKHGLLNRFEDPFWHLVHGIISVKGAKTDHWPQTSIRHMSDCVFLQKQV